MAEKSFLLKFGGNASQLVAAASQAGAAVQRFGQTVLASTSKLNNVGQKLQTGLNTINTVKPTAEMKRLQDQIKQTELRAQQLRQAYQKALSGLGTTGTPEAIQKVKSGLVVATTQANKLSKKLREAIQGGDPTKITKAKEALDKAVLKVDSLKSKLADLQAPPKPTAEIKKMGKEADAAEKEVEQLRQKLASLQTAAGAGGNMFSGMKMPNVSGALSSGIDKVPGIFNAAGKALLGLNSHVLRFSNMIRLSSQGLMHFGRSVTFFITLPLAGVLAGMTRQAIDFETALVRVSKTTGIVPGLIEDGIDQFEKLSDGLRDIAINSPTAAVELANLAAVLGQMGVQDTDQILKLTQIMDVMAITFGQAADEVATSMGKIASAFGYDLENASSEIWKLANVINELENTTNSLAGEIQTALLEFAPIAKTMNISMHEAAALSATLIALGYSASEAGTALKRMTEFLSRNADEIQMHMQGYSEAYESLESYMELLNTNPLQVFKDMGTIAGQMSEAGMSAEALVMLFEELGKIGGPALMSLANNMGLLNDNLDTANEQWDEATSIVTEYERAMQSTEAQMGLLKNNFTDLGITIGEAVLPVLRQLIQVLVPAVRRLSQWFQELQPSTQMTIVAFTLLGLVIGPLVIFLGQLVHSLSLVFIGMQQVITVFGHLVKNIGPIIKAVLLVGKAFLSWPGMVVLAVVAVLKILASLGVDIAGFFIRLADSAKKWGENLSKNIANGLIAGAIRFIAKAIAFIANMIASFFESHSPPEKGPLSTIDQWGKALMQTFLDGFALADFGILEDIASIIEDILTSGKEEGSLIKALGQLAANRVALAQLIEEFNATGVINEDLLDDATEGLGDMTDHVKNLIRLSLQYKAVQEKLADLEKRRKAVLKTYDEEIGAIGASNMSITEKIDAIRDAKRARDDSLTGIDKEEELLKEQAELLRQQVEYQQAMIETLQKQEDIFQRIADLMEQMKESAEETGEADFGGGGGGGGGGGLPEMPSMDDIAKEYKKVIEGIIEEWQGVIDRFSEGERAFQSMVDGWNGALLPYNANASELEQNMFKLGQRARAIADEFVRIGTEVSVAFDAVKTFFSSLSTSGESGEETKNPLLELLINGFSTGFSTDAFAALQISLDALNDSWNRLMETLGRAPIDFGGVSGALSALVGAVAWALGFIVGLVTSIIMILVTVINFLVVAVLEIVNFFSLASDSIAAFLNSLTGSVAGFLNNLGDFANSVAAFATSVYDWLQEINTWLEGGADASETWVADFVENIKNGIADFFAAGADVIAGFLNGLESKIQDVLTWFSGLGDKIKTAFMNVLGIASPSTVFFSFGANIIQGLINGAESLLGTLTSVFTGIGNTIIDTVKSIFGGGSKDTDENPVDSMLPSLEDVNAKTAEIRATIEQFANDIVQYLADAGIRMTTDWASTWSALGDTTTTVAASVGAFSTSVLGYMTEVSTGITNLWSGAWSGSELTVSNTAKGITTAISRMETSISSSITTVNGKIEQLSSVLKSAKLDTDSAHSSVNRYNSILVSLPVNRVTGLRNAWDGVRTSILNAITSLNSFISRLSALHNTRIQVSLMAYGSSASLTTSGTQDATTWTGTGTVTPKASGGSVALGTPYVVGELGPELFIPTQGGSILPNYLFDRMQEPGRSGGDIHIHIHNPVVRDDVDIKKLAQQVSRELAAALRRQNSMGSLPF